MDSTDDPRESAEGMGEADADAIARVLDGDIQQFAQLVSRYQVAMYRYARSIVLDHDAAADMVQDAFVRSYIHLASCRERTRFRAWLFQTLRNRCLDYLKEARRRTVRLEDVEPIVDEGEGPGELIERRRLRSQIRQALAGLPDAQREAFVMHYVEGVPYEAMAALLDVSVSALKMRVLRAREVMSVALKKAEVTEQAPARLSIRRA